MLLCLMLYIYIYIWIEVVNCIVTLTANAKQITANQAQELNIQ